MKTTPFSLIWPAIRAFAHLDPHGNAVYCRPIADPVKVVYLTDTAANGTARMLRELGQGDSTAYECPRNKGAFKGRHYHLTSRHDETTGDTSWDG